MKKRNLKEKILSLRASGETIQAIKTLLNCSSSTIAYHLYERTKKSTLARISTEDKKISRKRYYTKNKTNPIFNLKQKYFQFFRSGHRHKTNTTPTFSFDELLSIIPINPTCYLTGKSLDLTDSNNFSLDHKIPLSRGGENSLSNIGLCSWKANQSKNNMTPEEFKHFCQAVIDNLII